MVEEEKEKKTTSISRMLAGIGAAVAGGLILDKLLKKKPRKEDLQEAEGEGEFGENTLKEKIKPTPKEAGQFLSPQPKDYIPKHLESINPKQKQIFEEALTRRKENKPLKALELLDSIINQETANQSRIYALILAGNCKYSLLLFNDAINLYNSAIEESKKAGDRVARAVAHRNLGITLLQKYSLEKARRSCEEALKIYRELGDVEGEADTLSNLAVIYRKSGELEKAFKAQEEALKIHRKKEDKAREAEDLGNMGLILQQKGQVDKALEFYEKSLKLYTELQNKSGEAEQLGNIGWALQQKGDLDSAMKYEEDSLRIFREIGNQNGEANQLGNIGLIYQEKGELDKALGYYGDALRIHRQIGNRVSEATGMVNIGIIYRKKGEPEKAQDFLQKALKIFSELEAQPQIDKIKKQIKKTQDALIRKQRNLRQDQPTSLQP